MTAEQQAQDPMVSARAGVLAAVEAMGESGGPSLRPATVTSKVRLREPAGSLTTKLDARRTAGLELEGRDYPRRTTTILLTTGVALLGAVGIVGLLGTVAVFAVTIGQVHLLPVIIGLIGGLIGLGFVGGAVAHYASGDPLRLSTADRRSLAAARYWQSRQGWIGPLSGTRERRLALVARDLVERIATSPAWTSGELDGHRVQLDLIAELDQIDEQAYQLAHLRSTLPDGPHTALEQGWAALVDRVAALLVYAGRLGVFERELAAHQAEQRTRAADEQVARLLAGAARDDLAADTLQALTQDLAARRITTFGSLPESGT
ncbi:MAG TPA: hypothetical protein VG756_16610 [Pseudonocardiaceae bacterium]|nr:hypothetical protein [Pseudonocardiaceae bacterium]